jgi:ribosomal-protein-alanine N-acetyltransferase
VTGGRSGIGYRTGSETGGGPGSEPGCDVVLREAGPFDAGVIAELHRRCFADGLGGPVWSMASIAEVLSLLGSYAYLAAVAPEPGTWADTAEPVPAGFLLARTHLGESEILTLGVVADRRRQGTARALLRTAITRANLTGAARTLLEVAEDNMAARSLYAAEGFALVKRWPCYYRRPGGANAAALVFARNLP